MFDADVEAELANIATNLHVDLAALKAVVQVESGGRAFAQVDGKPMPLIRWEGHYFYRLLPANLRQTAIKKGLASTSWGQIKNPKSQQARYNLLRRAEAIHQEAALGSCSWGVGQVMGSHWEWLGYPSAQQMVATATSGIAGQMDLMVRFMTRTKCLDLLKAKDFYGLARLYNGKGQVTTYGKLITNAYKRYSGKSAAATDSNVLRVGSQDAGVSELQEKLRKLGYHLQVDGDFGPATRKALVALQTDQGLPADGILGPSTWSVIEGLLGASRAA